MDLTEEIIEKIDLYPGITDSHMHLIMMKEKGLDWKKLIQKCIDNGLELAMDIGTNTETFYERMEMCSAFPNIYMTDGLSVDKSEMEESELQIRIGELEKQIEENLNNPKFKGIGEIGLDNHYLYKGIEKQKKLFEAQMGIAEKYDLPVIIHTRDADRETTEILSSFKLSRGGIIHCFSGNYDAAKKYLDLGFYISFSGNITYKKSETIAETAAKIPEKFILAETDAPFLTPQKVRKYPNFSGFIGYTYDFIADLRKISAEELTGQITNNFKTFLRI